MFLIGVTGFCIKPLRDSGVMTIPELFEKKFGPKIRWAAGVVIVLGGLLNMGVFLRTGGEFLVQVTGMNIRYLEITMTALLLLVAVYTILGGMLSVLVTDFLQFVVMSVGLIVVTIVIIGKVGWGTIVKAVETKLRRRRFQSLRQPRPGLGVRPVQSDARTAAVLTWQTTIVRVLSSKDTKTGLKVYKGTAFFFVCRFLIPGIWGMAALAFLTSTQVGANTLGAMPMLLSQLLPAGLMGLLIAAMLAADMSSDSSYMITWAGVIYNDIMAPFRKKPWSEKKGLPLEPVDRRADRGVPPRLRPLVSPQGRPVDLSRRHRDDLPVEHVGPPHRLQLLEKIQ